jgi:hypothetical protein
MLLSFHRLTVNELFAEKSSIWLFEDLLVFGALSKSDTVMYNVPCTTYICTDWRKYCHPHFVQFLGSYQTPGWSIFCTCHQTLLKCNSNWHKINKSKNNAE